MSWEPARKLQWKIVTALGTRRVMTFLQRRLGSYEDTHLFFDGVKGKVALTFDDGLSRGGSDTSLVSVVLNLLKQHDARGTFFVCSNYLKGCLTEAAELIADGHEIANHLQDDDSKPAAHLPAETFEAELEAATEAIEQVPGARVRWFRAPHGLYTRQMQRTVHQHGLRHALADSYCDDWSVRDPKWIASTLLRQVRDGSIIALHMPEQNFRSHTLEALVLVLQGLKERGLKCTTLSDLSSAAPGCNGGHRRSNSGTSCTSTRSVIVE